MKAYYIKAITAALFVTLFSGVKSTSAQTLQPCGTTEYREKLFNENPGLREKIEAFEKQQALNNHRVAGVDTTVYIIPIVFHIIHSYSTDDITDAQVIDAVRILNLDYRHRNLDSGAVVPAFKSIAADARIEFRLAQKDPQGNPTNGIDRVYSPKTNGGSDASKLNDWNPKMYLNVWTTSTIGTAGVAGYSNYPSTYLYQNQRTDGVLILSSYIGSIGTGSPNTSRALTHEIGHYLNLAHVWGSNNQPGMACGDDGVTDTPISFGWTTCNLSSNDKCYSGIQENVQNYMEYSYCSNMFTAGQVDRMRTALRSTVASRSNLSDSSNLAATGVLNKPPLVPVPVADFNPSPTFVCQGSSVVLKDLSWKGTPTSWKWVLPGSEYGIYTTQNPAVKYTTPGIYNITLIVQNATGIDSVTKTSMVYVNSTTANAIPYKESFEEPGDISTSLGWGAVNQYNDAVKWTKTDQYSYSGSQSLILGNISSKDSLLKDALISPNFDFSKATDPQLAFKYAYARKKSTNSDVLRIYYSLNCGVSWYFATSFVANKLATVQRVHVKPQTDSIFTKTFLPVDRKQWMDTVLKMPPAVLGQANVMFKFEYTYALTGNNLFIDDIGFYPDRNSFLVSGQAELDAQKTWISISPNPVEANQELKVTYNSSKNSSVAIVLYDIAGRVVQHITDKSMLQGDGDFSINTNGLKPGIYIMAVNGSNISKQFKIVIQ